MLVSIIVPCHNEAANIGWFHSELTNLLQKEKIKYEILYVDDGSTDTSPIILRQLNQTDPKRIQIISLSRNFGKEAATTAGIHYSSGDVAIIMDGDGQHPIQLIPNIIKKWQISGADTVIGIRISNSGEGFIKKFGSILFYKIFNKFSGEQKLIPSATDFRLISRAIIEDFKLLEERSRITRGLLDWLGYKKEYFHFSANERRYGNASYDFSKLLKLAINSFTSLSFTPLYLSLYAGGFIIFTSFILLVGMFVEQVILGDPLQLAITGSAYLGVVVLFLVGIVLISQGMMAYYIGKIFNETRARPLYLINKHSSTIHAKKIR